MTNIYKVSQAHHSQSVFRLPVCPDLHEQKCWIGKRFVLKEEKVYSGTAETFGKTWQVGDVVGVFLDLIDRTISKTEFLSERFSCHFKLYMIWSLEIDYWIQILRFLTQSQPYTGFLRFVLHRGLLVILI